MIKIVTVCGAGVGSSMMERVFTQEILNRNDIEAEVDAADIGSVSPAEYDIVITTSDFAEQLSESTARIIRIDNLMDKAYLEEQLLKTIEEINS